MSISMSSFDVDDLFPPDATPFEESDAHTTTQSTQSHQTPFDTQESAQANTTNAVQPSTQGKWKMKIHRKSPDHQQPDTNGREATDSNVTGGASVGSNGPSPPFAATTIATTTLVPVNGAASASTLPLPLPPLPPTTGSGPPVQHVIALINGVNQWVPLSPEFYPVSTVPIPVPAVIAPALSSPLPISQTSPAHGRSSSKSSLPASPHVRSGSASGDPGLENELFHRSNVSIAQPGSEPNARIQGLQAIQTMLQASAERSKSRTVSMDASPSSTSQQPLSETPTSPLGSPRNRWPAPVPQLSPANRSLAARAMAPPGSVPLFTRLGSGGATPPPLPVRRASLIAANVAATPTPSNQPEEPVNHEQQPDNNQSTTSSDQPRTDENDSRQGDVSTHSSDFSSTAPSLTLPSSRSRTSTSVVSGRRRSRTPTKFAPSATSTFIDTRPAFDASFQHEPVPRSQARLEREARGAMLLEQQMKSGYHFSRRETQPPPTRSRSNSRSGAGSGSGHTTPRSSLAAPPPGPSHSHQPPLKSTSSRRASVGPGAAAGASTTTAAASTTPRPRALSVGRLTHRQQQQQHAPSSSTPGRSQALIDALAAHPANSPASAREEELRARQARKQAAERIKQAKEAKLAAAVASKIATPVTAATPASTHAPSTATTPRLQSHARSGSGSTTVPPSVADGSESADVNDSASHASTVPDTLPPAPGSTTTTTSRRSSLGRLAHLAAVQTVAQEAKDRKAAALAAVAAQAAKRRASSVGRTKATAQGIVTTPVVTTVTDVDSTDPSSCTATTATPATTAASKAPFVSSSLTHGAPTSTGSATSPTARKSLSSVGAKSTASASVTKSHQPTPVGPAAVTSAPPSVVRSMAAAQEILRRKKEREEKERLAQEKQQAAALSSESKQDVPSTVPAPDEATPVNAPTSDPVATATAPAPAEPAAPAVPSSAAADETLSSSSIIASFLAEASASIAPTTTTAAQETSSAAVVVPASKPSAAATKPRAGVISLPSRGGAKAASKKPAAATAKPASEKAPTAAASTPTPPTVTSSAITPTPAPAAAPLKLVSRKAREAAETPAPAAATSDQVAQPAEAIAVTADPVASTTETAEVQVAQVPESQPSTAEPLSELPVVPDSVQGANNSVAIPEASAVQPLVEISATIIPAESTASSSLGGEDSIVSLEPVAAAVAASVASTELDTVANLPPSTSTDSLNIPSSAPSRGASMVTPSPSPGFVSPSPDPGFISPSPAMGASGVNGSDEPLNAASLHAQRKPKFVGEHELCELADTMRRSGNQPRPPIDHLIYRVAEASREDRAHALGKVRLHQKLILVQAGTDALTETWREKWLQPQEAFIMFIMTQERATSGDLRARFIFIEWTGSDCPSDVSSILQELTSQVERVLRKIVPLSLTLQASHPSQVSHQAFAEDLNSNASDAYSTDTELENQARAARAEEEQAKLNQIQSELGLSPSNVPTAEANSTQ